jgi:hypothetical protein
VFPVPNPLQNKTIASFDVGIKHLAYCVLERRPDYNTGLEYRGFDKTARVAGDYANVINLLKPERGVIKGAFIKNGCPLFRPR